MDDPQRLMDLQVLAKMAARLAGRDPEQHVKVELAGAVAFEGPIWSYPDFIARAEMAYAMLVSSSPAARK
jgi:hypothetical protein